MAWSATQKQIAVRACKAAGIDEQQRRDMILRNFRNARTKDGRITSTAPRLDNRDFEQFMSIVESHAGGRPVLHFSDGYWQRKAMDGTHRIRDRVSRIAHALDLAGNLQPDGIGLAGWIRKRVSGGRCDTIEQLNYHELLALLLGLQAYARQHGVEFESEADHEASAEETSANA